MARFAYKNSLGAGWSLSFLDNEGSSSTPGFLGVLYHANTAERTYTFPDKSGTIPTTADVTDKVMTTLGDLIIGGSSGAASRLAGNTTTTTQFLKSLGSAGLATAPVWAQPAAADLSNGVTGSGAVVLAQGPTFSGAKVSFPASAAGYASINLASGVAVSSPASGDLWNQGGVLYFRTGGGVSVPLSDALADGTSGTGAVVRVQGPTFSGAKVLFPASAAGYASLNLPAGAAVSTPASGDLWNVGGDIYWSNGTQTQTLSEVVSSVVGNGTLNLDGRLKDVIQVDLQGATTINMVNGGRDTQRLMLALTQDATGNRSVTLGTGFAWGADVTSYSPTTTANKTDYIGLIYSTASSAWRVIAVSKGY